MAMDSHSITDYRGRRRWSCVWDLESPRLFFAQFIYCNQVRSSDGSVCFFTYFCSPPVAQNHSTIPTSQFILNDTSLAAVSDASGNRHLFFQDTTGLLRGMKYNSHSDQWSASLNMGTNSSAKNYTPLAATQYGLEVLVI